MLKNRRYSIYIESRYHYLFKQDVINMMLPLSNDIMLLDIK